MRPRDREHAAPEPLPQSAARLVGGVAIFALMAFVVPAFWPGLATGESEVIVVKNLLVLVLAATALVCAAVRLLASGALAAYRDVAPAAVALLAYAAVVAASALLGPAPAYSLERALPTLATILVAAGAPLLLTRRGFFAPALWGLLAAGVFVAATAIASQAGDRHFNRLVYGVDPRDALEDPALRDRLVGMGFGGMERSATLSTLGNPEYTGGFLAVVAVLALVIAIDWPARSRRPVLVLIAGMMAAAAVTAGALATQTRAVVLVLGLGFLARMALLSPLRGWQLALAPLLVLGAMAVGGPMAGLIAGALVSLAGIAWMAWTGALSTLWRESAAIQRVAFAGAVAGALAAAVFVALPAGINPLGARIAARFTALARGDDASARERVAFYMIAAEQWRSNPVLGVGPGRYGPEFLPALASVANADPSGTVDALRFTMQDQLAEFSHSDFLQVLAETGLLGLATFLAAVLLVLVHGARLVRSSPDDRPLALGIACLVVASLANSLVSGPLHFAGRGTIFWVALGLLLALAAIRGAEARAAGANPPAAPAP